MDYNNPIEFVYGATNNYHMRFATRDGGQGVQPLCAYSFFKSKIYPPGSFVAKIQVWNNGSYLTGIRFFSKEGVCVLQSGYCTGTVQDIPLQEGERLLAVKSKLVSNDPTSTGHHCNPIFVIGRLE